MKFKVTFKTPDALENSIKEAVNHELSKLELDPRERHHLLEDEVSKIKQQFAPFFKWNELLKVECDTEDTSIKVLKT